MPTSPTSAAPAFAGTTRIGSASAACINSLIAATTAAADRRAAARGLLGREGLLHRLGDAGGGLERHLGAREVAALVRRHASAAGGEAGGAGGRGDQGFLHCSFRSSS